MLSDGGDSTRSRLPASAAAAAAARRQQQQQQQEAAAAAAPSLVEALRRHLPVLGEALGRGAEGAFSPAAPYKHPFADVVGLSGTSPLPAAFLAEGSARAEAAHQAAAAAAQQREDAAIVEAIAGGLLASPPPPPAPPRSRAEERSLVMELMAGMETPRFAQ